MNDRLHQKLAESLTARSVKLLPYLPYLLQDLFDLGSSPQTMADLVRKEIPDPAALEFLDLCCGKGAVSIHLAHRFGCRGKGVDLMPEFIEEACQKASLKGVRDLLMFEVGDVASAVQTECGFDLVILGAAGDVLGDPQTTLRKLRQVLREGGYILIDDVYVREGSSADYLTRADWLAAFSKTGTRLLAEQVEDPDDLHDLNERQQVHIRQRARELAKQHPREKELFEDYVQSQQQECDELDSDLTGVTFLLQIMAAKPTDEMR